MLQTPASVSDLLFTLIIKMIGLVWIIKSDCAIEAVLGVSWRQLQHNHGEKVTQITSSLSCVYKVWRDLLRETFCASVSHAAERWNQDDSLLVVRGPAKPQLLVPSLIHTHSCKHLCTVLSLSRHDSGHSGY